MNTPYKMVTYPTSDYAVSYCLENGLVLGGTYHIHKYDSTTVYISVITDFKIVEVGSRFFKDHFEMDLRTINLEKLGI
jgi:hypothetical protein